jgi:hypothetical protein
MRKYTEKIHAQRVEKIMNKKDPCDLCPAGKYYEGHRIAEMWDNGLEACQICKTFVGSKPYCPCGKFGREEAIRRTRIALKKKGYLDDNPI